MVYKTMIHQTKSTSNKLVHFDVHGHKFIQAVSLLQRYKLINTVSPRKKVHTLFNKLIKAFQIVHVTTVVVVPGLDSRAHRFTSSCVYSFTPSGLDICLLIYANVILTATPSTVTERYRYSVRMATLSLIWPFLRGMLPGLPLLGSSGDPKRWV